MVSPLAGTDTLNLYDVGALAHLELTEDRAYAPAKTVAHMQTKPATVLEDMHDQLGRPSGFARAPVRDRLPLRRQRHGRAPAGAVHRGAYLRPDRREPLLRRLRPAPARRRPRPEPWGASFVAGAGNRFPVCLHHQVANLVGSLNGRPPLLLGAVVPGPVDVHQLSGLSAAEGYRPCPVRGGAGAGAYAQFNGRGAGYEDNVLADVSNEPSDDLAALSLPAFASEAGG